MKKLINSLSLSVLLISLAFAGTDGTIRGKVTDIEGSPLPGANIYVPDVGVGQQPIWTKLYHIKHTCRRVRRGRSNDGLSKADYDGSWCCYGSDCMA